MAENSGYRDLQPLNPDVGAQTPYREEKTVEAPTEKRVSYRKLATGTEKIYMAVGEYEPCVRVVQG